MAMVENLIKQNPQLNNAWQMAQQLSQNGNKQEVINQIAKQKGVSVDEVRKMANSYGINI
jgi:DNA-directed RNA polymerase sigma subunit (sigma70/sigma32)